jgi:hypothetical protein
MPVNENPETIALTGRMITSVDPTTLGQGDFQNLSNMRYTDTGILSTKGMTKINSSPVTKPSITAGIHFVKNYPSESHVLVQGIAADTSSAIYDNTTAIPSTGNFGSAIFSETAGASAGKFSHAPDGTVIYGNSKDLVIWGGAESRTAAFIVANQDDAPTAPTVLYDYTTSVTDNDITTYALIKQRYVHIASTRKLQGVKFYVTTANTATVTASVKYWTSSGAWAAVSGFADGTSSGGVTLAQTGSITFTSTVSTATVRYFNNQLAYWYLFDFNGVDATTQIYLATLDAPFQSITDLWDGFPLQIASFQIFKTTYQEYGSHVFSNDYVSGAPTTYVDLNGLTTSQYVIVGFTQRMQGLRINVVPTNPNTATTTINASYWNGTAFTSLTPTDKTTAGGISLANTGVVYWTPPAASAEFTTAITTPDLFYYYKISWNTNTVANSGGVLIDSIFGIPVSTQLDVYKFPAMFQNRPVLCNNQKNEAHTILIGSANANCVFNGSDSIKLYFGDGTQVLGAVPFFSRFSNAFFENLIVGKADSMWVVDGTNTDEYKTFQISSVYGLAAPGTLTSCDLGFSNVPGAGTARNVVLWQSSKSICIWEGSIVYPIHLDIADVFDQANSYAIDLTMHSQSKAFYDEELREWHWLWASQGNTTLNMEYVFDLGRRKWYKIDRGTGNRLQLGISVIDTNNARYTYGALATGYIERLEYGQTFDGTSITSSFWTGDIPLGRNWISVTELRRITPIMKAKATTTNTLQLDYYGDTGTTVKKTFQINVNDSSNRIVQSQPGKSRVDSLGSVGGFIFHSFKCTMTTSNENYCFEPIGLAVQIDKIRDQKQ